MLVAKLAVLASFVARAMAALVGTVSVGVFGSSVVVTSGCQVNVAVVIDVGTEVFFSSTPEQDISTKAISMKKTIVCFIF